MRIIFAAIAIWYGIWEGLMEPVLPYHKFTDEDINQLIVGVLSGIGAYYIRVNALDKSIEGGGKSLSQTRQYMFLFISFGLTWFFLFPIMESFDAEITPYTKIAFRLTNNTILDISGQHKGYFYEIGYLVWTAAVLMPFSISLVKTIVISRIAVFTLSRVFHKTLMTEYNNGLIKKLPVHWVLLFHLLIPLIFLIGYE